MSNVNESDNIINTAPYNEVFDTPDGTVNPIEFIADNSVNPDVERRFKKLEMYRAAGDLSIVNRFIDYDSLPHKPTILDKAQIHRSKKAQIYMLRVESDLRRAQMMSGKSNYWSKEARKLERKYEKSVRKFGKTVISKASVAIERIKPVEQSSSTLQGVDTPTPTEQRAVQLSDAIVFGRQEKKKK